MTKVYLVFVRFGIPFNILVMFWSETVVASKAKEKSCLYLISLHRVKAWLSWKKISGTQRWLAKGSKQQKQDINIFCILLRYIFWKRDFPGSQFRYTTMTCKRIESRNRINESIRRLGSMNRIKESNQWIAAKNWINESPPLDRHEYEHECCYVTTIEYKNSPC